MRLLRPSSWTIAFALLDTIIVGTTCEQFIVAGRADPVLIGWAATILAANATGRR